MFSPRILFTARGVQFFSLLFLAAIVILFSTGSKSIGSYLYSGKAGHAAYIPAISRHQISIDGKVLNYNATAGYLQLANNQGDAVANIFYVAYTADSTNQKRPVTFVFNGGPGSASIWLHMGSFGPVRVLFKNDKGDAPAANYNHADNPNTWLGFTDLVFIDPVGTGYSRPADGLGAKRFYGYSEDIATIGEFIRRYLVQHKRQNSPKFLTGESYGSVRAIGLAAYLKNRYQTSFTGITLISPALNYQLISFRHGNETPFSYYLPSYAVAAQYHHRLNPGLQRLSPQQLIAKVQVFAQQTYTLFLNQGDMATAKLSNEVIDSLHYYTGLPKNYLRTKNGRVTDREFAAALLKQDSLQTGTYDSRFTGSNPGTDPSETNLRGLFTASFNNYIVKNLNYHNNLPYLATTAVGDWNYGPEATNSYLDVSETLKGLMSKSPGLKINIIGGYYDLATPVGATSYVVNHMGLSPALRNNISVKYYASGHMVYISKTANAELRADGEKLYQTALANVN